MKMKQYILAVFTSLALGGTAQAAVVFSENFDLESVGLNYRSFAQFNVTSGSVDLLGAIPPPDSYDYYPGNGNYVDLDGTTTNKTPVGQITTKMSFAPGTYTLSFTLGGNFGGDTNTVRVEFGNFMQDITVPAKTDLAYHEVTFDTTGGRLSFTNYGNSDKRGLMLDNVQLSSAVPESSTWAMMLIGFAGLAFASQRKRAMVAA